MLGLECCKLRACLGCDSGLNLGVAILVSGLLQSGGCHLGGPPYVNKVGGYPCVPEKPALDQDPGVLESWDPAANGYSRILTSVVPVEILNISGNSCISTYFLLYCLYFPLCCPYFPLCCHYFHYFPLFSFIFPYVALIFLYFPLCGPYFPLFSFIFPYVALIFLYFPLCGPYFPLCCHYFHYFLLFSFIFPYVALVFPYVALIFLYVPLYCSYFPCVAQENKGK